MKGIWYIVCLSWCSVRDCERNGSNSTGQDLGQLPVFETVHTALQTDVVDAAAIKVRAGKRTLRIVRTPY